MDRGRQTERERETDRQTDRERDRETERQTERELDSWCFKPSQPQRITSGLRERERLRRWGVGGR